MVFNRAGHPAFEQAFSFERIAAIAKSSGGATSPEALMQSLLDGCDVAGLTHQGSGVEMALDVRPGERDLLAKVLVAGDMKPTAVFNSAEPFCWVTVCFLIVCLRQNIRWSAMG